MKSDSFIDQMFALHLFYSNVAEKKLSPLLLKVMFVTYISEKKILYLLCTLTTTSTRLRLIMLQGRELCI